MSSVFDTLLLPSSFASSAPIGGPRHHDFGGLPPPIGPPLHQNHHLPGHQHQRYGQPPPSQPSSGRVFVNSQRNNYSYNQPRGGYHGPSSFQQSSNRMTQYPYRPHNDVAKRYNNGFQSSVPSHARSNQRQSSQGSFPGLRTITSTVHLSSSKADNDALFLRHLMKEIRIDRPASASASAVVAPCAGYPSVLVSEIGTISVLLMPDVVVEVSVDRSIRIACLGKFAACLTHDSAGVSLSHEQASIFQEGNSVFTIFRVGGIEKQVVMGEEGIVYSMDGNANCFLVSDALGLNAAGNSVLPVQKKLFPSMRRDFTLRQFYANAETGKRCIDMCHEFVARANFITEDGETRVIVNGIYIRLDRSGNVEISSRPRQVRFTPSTGAIHIKTPEIETAIDVSFSSHSVVGRVINVSLFRPKVAVTLLSARSAFTPACPDSSSATNTTLLRSITPASLSHRFESVFVLIVFVFIMPLLDVFSRNVIIIVLIDKKAVTIKVKATCVIRIKQIQQRSQVCNVTTDNAQVSHNANDHSHSLFPLIRQVQQKCHFNPLYLPNHPFLLLHFSAMSSGNLTPDGLTTIHPLVKTPLTDKFQLPFSYQGSPCGFFEAQFYKCMEAFGTKLGRLHCDLEHRDFGECISHDKQKKRYDAMRAEHWKQYIAGKRNAVYENHVKVGQLTPDYFEHGKL
uniref:NADH dehydrogenase [ubiquinone] iron-sulfur protein 5 n=1 Tax=Panagrellus redivivus TaxID=6233 RepID=A0A7E4ZYX5_PANRE